MFDFAYNKINFRALFLLLRASCEFDSRSDYQNHTQPFGLRVVLYSFTKHTFILTKVRYGARAQRVFPQNFG